LHLRTWLRNEELILSNDHRAEGGGKATPRISLRGSLTMALIGGPHRTQNQVMETSCWFGSGQGHQGSYQ
jgi:hypothetical protein